MGQIHVKGSHLPFVQRNKVASKFTHHFLNFLPLALGDLSDKFSIEILQKELLVNFLSLTVLGP